MINHVLTAYAKIVILGCLLVFSKVAPAGHNEQIHIGVLSFRPVEHTLAQWRPLSAILKQAIPEHDFVLEALTLPELNEAVASRQLDFVLTNPGHYVQIAYQYGLSAPLATLINNEQGRALSVFGGVIFGLAERNDLNTLASVRGKTVAVTSTESLGGYQMQAYELLQTGINVSTDSQLLTTGMPHDLVVEAVLTRRADIGFVRTGVLESMAREGRLDRRRIKILNDQRLPDFPLLLSTRLYPEWPFVALPMIDSQLARRVAGTLLLMDNDQVPGIKGFTVPADYKPVEHLLRTLRVKPFDAIPEFTLTDIWQRYQWQVLILGITFSLIIVLSLRLLMLNRSLALERKLVQQQNKCIEDNEYRWKFALEGTGEGVWDWNIATGEAFFSAYWKVMLGYEQNEFSENFDTWYDSIHPDDRSHVLSKINDYFASKEPVYQVEFRLRCKDGRYKWILSKGMIVARSEDGKPWRMIGTHSDISERKHTELELQKSHDLLLRSNADLEQFAYSVSHDLRQPLRMVTGHLRFLERSLHASLNENDHQNLAFAVEGAKRMDSMIMSLLEYSQVGRKNQQTIWMDSRDCWEEVNHYIQPLVDETGAIIINRGEWPKLYASRDLLTRLLQNLLTNAIKFHELNRVPEVEVLSEVHYGLWQVRIHDHGIGIEPQQIGYLFQFFSHLQSRERFEGTGMGLALCRRIVEHHHGRIWAESEGEGLGATFIFELPIASPVIS